MKAFWGLVTRIVLLAFVSLSLPAHASLMSAEDTLPVHQSAERTHVMNFLARADVEKVISAQGVDIAQVKQRVAAMSDDEVTELSGKIDQLPAAGDGGVIGVVLFVFVLLLITDILGLTKVFPFTRSVR